MTTMYGTVSGNGKYDFTREELLAQVRECPIFSDPDDVSAESLDDDGTKIRYTGRELCEMAGVEMQTGE
jgi:hypothetical protein